MKIPRFSLMNVRSLLPKIDELSARISCQPTNVIAITESWLSEDIDDNLLSIEGFNIYRKDEPLVEVAVFALIYHPISQVKEG